MPVKSNFNTCQFSRFRSRNLLLKAKNSIFGAKSNTMKHNYLIFGISFLSLLWACDTPKESQSYTIEGSLPTEIKGTVYLLEYRNRDYTVVDSVNIENGLFSFKGTVTEPLLYSLRLNNVGKRASFLLENAHAKIKLNTDWEIETLEGTKNMNLFREYEDTNRKKPINLDSLLKIDNHSPAVAYFLARNAYLYDYPQLTSLRKQIAPELHKNTYIQELDQAIAKLEVIQPGKHAPEIIMENVNGETFKLSDLRGKNVLIEFWASWCVDCRKGNPELVKLFHTYKDANFTILGVSLDRNKEDWKQTIIKDGLVWEHGFVEGAWKSEPAKTYAIRWLPTAILIDSNGIIVARHISNEKLATDIETLIQKK